MRVKACPQRVRKGGGVGAVDAHRHRLSLKRGQRLPVGHIGVDEVAHAENGRFVFKEVPAGLAGIAVQGFYNGKAVRAAGSDDAGNAGGVVGGVGLKAAGHKRRVHIPAHGHEIPDGVGLVAVGHDCAAQKIPHRVVDDKAGVGHGRRVEGLGLYAVLGFYKDPVAAVFAAAHDKICSHGVSAVLAAAQNYSPARVGVFPQ